MAEDSSRLSKRIRSVFLLDPSKLGRLLNVIENKFKDLGEVTQHYHVTLQSGRDLAVNSADHVLDQDNAVRNPINQLSMLIATVNGASEAMVNFDREDSEIDIRVSSPNVKWAAELFGEIEEQVERTLVHSWVYALKSSREGWLSIISLIVAGSMAITMAFSLQDISGPSDEKRLLLTSQNVQRLGEMVRAAKTMEDRVAFLTEFHTAQLQALAQREARISPLVGLSMPGWQAALVALPVIIALIAAWYLFARCYPGSVFAWGDYADHFKTLVERRKFLWNAIVMAVAIGLVTNFAVYGAAYYLSP
jgi:hypothetical protein